MANCIACHSQNPAMDGALGPAVAGSSYELIEARVMRAEYPPGYTPKRDSRVMIALPHLKDQIGALAAYLDSIPKS
jgi:mono/diheme cytochrome c family protein